MHYRGDAARTGVFEPSDPLPGFQPWSVRTGGPIDWSPVVADGTVYAGSCDHKVYALDARTGQRRWRFTVHNGPTTMAGAPAVAVHDGTVYAASTSDPVRTGVVFALDAATGRVVWRRDLPAGVRSSPAVVDGALYVGCDDESLYRIDAATGDTQWRAAMPGPCGTASPAVADGRVFMKVRAASYQLGLADALHADGDPAQVMALDAATGDLLWSHALRERNAGPDTGAVRDGVLYIGSSSGELSALSAETGTPLWTLLTQKRTIATGQHISGFTEPAVTADRVYTGGQNGMLSAFDRKTALRRWYQEHTWPYGAAAVAGSTVYTARRDGLLSASSAKTGDPVWAAVLLGGRDCTAPTVAHGAVYVGSGSWIAAYDAETGATPRRSRWWHRR
ncbi:outer membrane protein assembly factor BamB [Murinocardiopsis flavida]|uniref:Outer membrane protein assembly factor BamB n=1 Tax=Murinocardiopsis flavida TaxID=645275 RepID=A0A2P8DFJ8_9ACTN|nr:PQQ-binding-like beta-propeller repeat protein [Murinocardiopsis flavida]PSK95986.1 outer membrane protein assembly factor BamB [Murinocardiopsis flavida]